MHNGQDVFVNEVGEVSFDSEILPNYKSQNAFSFSHPLSNHSVSLNSSSDLNGYCKPEPYSSEVSCDTSNSIQEQIQKIQERRKKDKPEEPDHSKVLISSLNSTLSNFTKDLQIQKEKRIDLDSGSMVDGNTTKEVKLNMVCTCCEKCLKDKENYPKIAGKPISGIKRNQIKNKKGKLQKIDLTKYLKSTRNLNKDIKKTHPKSFSMSYTQYRPSPAPLPDSNFHLSMEKVNTSKFTQKSNFSHKKMNSFAIDSSQEEATLPSSYNSAKKSSKSPYTGIENIQERMRQKKIINMIINNENRQWSLSQSSKGVKRRNYSTYDGRVNVPFNQIFQEERAD